ncbi:MAG: energy transducer TonB, partial [Vicinamibacterales bacterium]
LYSSARIDYENKKYVAAAAGFKQVLQVISAVDPEAQTATLADTKELASGFLVLAEAKATPDASFRASATPRPVAPGPAAIAPVAPAPAAPAPGAAAPAATAKAAAPAPPVVTEMLRPFFTLSDSDVTPPVVVEQPFPRWSSATNLPERALRGTLELVIDENGAVESATLVEPVWPPYDAELLHLARKWRYEPALKQGKPVRFKRVLVIKVDPRTQRSR